MPKKGVTYLRLTEQVHWIMMLDGHALACDFPRLLKMDDEGRPHCEDGPALQYRDGKGSSFWHGQIIPDAWLKGAPPKPVEALHWPNMDQRAAACEIVGWHKILDELNAKTIDKSDDPVWGKLIEADVPDSGPERFLDVICGTGRRFALPVPPTTKTVDEAQSVLHGGLPPELLKFSTERT